MLLCLCGCGNNDEPAPEDPVTLTMWHVYGSQTQSPLNNAIDEFNSTVGKEKGITIDVVSVTSSSAIDKALAASANGEPGAEDMPDLFTAYPRVAEIVGMDKLLRWDEYFSDEALSGFKKEFLDEGYFGGKLLMLPIAKSTEALYVNKTLFDRFSAEADVDSSNLQSFEGLFETARLYYDMYGQSMLQINDYYNYALVGMKLHGSEFVRNGKLRIDDKEFYTIWEPLAKAAIYGGICLEDGYAASRWKTVEIIGNTGSTADVLYQPTEVVYPDNTTEKIEAVAFPYPEFAGGKHGVVTRGGGLFAVRSDDERKNRAAYIFAEWLTENENNLSFVTNAGYLPVKNDALETLFSDVSIVETESYRSVYRAVGEMNDDYTIYTLPLYSGASESQLGFESGVKTVLISARSQYIKRTSEGEIPEDVLSELVSTSLSDLKRLMSE